MHWNTRELLYAKWTDPLAGASAVPSPQARKSNELSLAANNMVSFYGQLCDSHLVKAEYEASIGNSRLPGNLSGKRWTLRAGLR